MSYELVKNEFIKLKMEELDYIDKIVEISTNKVLSEYEKLEIYRELKKYKIKLNEVIKKLYNEAVKDEQLDSKDIIIEFNVAENYLSKAKSYEYRKYLLENLNIEVDTLKFKLTLHNLARLSHYGYVEINSDMIQNNQKLMEKQIYIFEGYYDSSEDLTGPMIFDHDSYIYAVYEDIRYKYNYPKNILKKKMYDFEKDKIIIRAPKYIKTYEIQKIFEEELLNTQNNSINDCIIKTKNRIEELSHLRSPEYKEKSLLDRINELYKKVKGEFIQKEILYSGDFLDILKETYKLPNEKIVKKEKIIKNGGKNSVIVIAITQDNEYIITFQNRIKDKIIAEFPSGYIENNENPVAAAKRELQEETGYISDDLFIVDSAFTSPGIDNSITYIVIANNCIKTDEIKTASTELVNYGLFSELELKYLITRNIMNGAMNKLAYYNLINNVDDCNFVYVNGSKRTYKKLRKNKFIL